MKLKAVENYRQLKDKAQALSLDCMWNVTSILPSSVILLQEIAKESLLTFDKVMFFKIIHCILLHSEFISLPYQQGSHKLDPMLWNY